jgi:hypothetical protein
MRQVVALGVGYIGFAAFAAWSAYASSQLTGAAHTPQAIWPYVAGAGGVSAALAAALVWLAVYSANHGYDRRCDPDDY